MDNQGKHAWLDEVMTDMVIYCANNELFESGAILNTARGIIISEVASQKLRYERRLEALKKSTKMPK